MAGRGADMPVGGGRQAGGAGSRPRGRGRTKAVFNRLSIVLPSFDRAALRPPRPPADLPPPPGTRRVQPPPARLLICRHPRARATPSPAPARAASRRAPGSIAGYRVLSLRSSVAVRCCVVSGGRSNVARSPRPPRATSFHCLYRRSGRAPPLLLAPARSPLRADFTMGRCPYAPFCIKKGWAVPILYAM